MSTDLDYKHFCWTKCISWTAVLTGALVAIGLGFLLQLFGLSIGLTAFTTDKEGMAALAIGGYIGLIIGVIVTMFVSGWVAGYLGQHYFRNLNYYNRRIGSIYGFVTWCVALIIMVILTSQVNEYIFVSRTTLENPGAVMSRSTVEKSSVPMERSRAVSTTHERAASAMPGDNAEEKNTRLVGVTIFSLFLLFFIGAVSSTFGGIYGFRPRDEEYEIETPRRRKAS